MVSCVVQGGFRGASVENVFEPQNSWGAEQDGLGLCIRSAPFEVLTARYSPLFWFGLSAMTVNGIGSGKSQVGVSTQLLKKGTSGGGAKTRRGAL
jgi:hypothetical protein